MSKNRDEKVKAEVDKVILTLCSRIRLKTEDSNSITAGELVEVVNAIAALIEARSKIDENVSTNYIKLKLAEILRKETADYDY